MALTGRLQDDEVPLCVRLGFALQPEVLARLWVERRTVDMRELGAAIAGTGFMGWVHIEALRRIGIPIVGVLGSTPAKGRAMASRFRIPKAYDTYDQLLSDTDVRAVHVVTPNRYHFDMASRALQADKHVMCEKPLAMDSNQTARLLEILDERCRLAAGVNYNVRFYPLCMEARQRVRSGSIGDVVHITGSYQQDWLLYASDYNWRVLVGEGGLLRAVADIGTHWLDLMQSISGSAVQAVCADLQTVHAVRRRPQVEVQTFEGKAGISPSTEPIEIATDDYGCVMLHFQGGARGVVHVSQVTAGRKNRLQFDIAGTGQSLAWNSESPNDLWIGNRDRPNEALLRDPALMSDLARGVAEFPGGHNEGHASTFKQCFRTFYDYIFEDDFETEPPFPTFADGHREVVLCEAILDSHRQRGWVEVPGVEQCNLDS